METRANYALVGLFTLATIAAALGFVVWFARLADANKATHYQVVFTGSVSGLTVGSSVLFNGLRVGQVERLDLYPDDPSRVIGLISVKDGTPVKVDTRARMEFQGVTGGAYIQLYGGSAATALLEAQDGQQYAVIYAERSELQNLVDGARDTVTQAAQTLSRLDNLLRENEDNISSTIKNVETFTKVLSDNGDNIAVFLQNTGEAAKSIGRLSDGLSGMTDDVQRLVKAVDPAKVERVVANVTQASEQLATFSKAFDAAKAQQAIANVEAFTKMLADSREPLQSFATDASALAGKLNAMAPKLEASLEEIRRISSAIDSVKVGKVVDNVEQFTAMLGRNSAEFDGIVANANALSAELKNAAPKLAEALQSFNKVAAAIDAEKIDRVLANVDRFAATLGNSSEDVRKVVADASEIGRKLNAAADQIDGILKNVAAMTTSEQGKGMFAEFGETARAIRVLAQNLDQRTAVLSRSLEQFASGGLRDYRQLAVDGQKTLLSIQRTLNNLQRNPQQLIFGPKSTIPDFKGK